MDLVSGALILTFAFVRSVRYIEQAERRFDSGLHAEARHRKPMSHCLVDVS
jgi:hypothetical protein